MGSLAALASLAPREVGSQPQPEPAAEAKSPGQTTTQTPDQAPNHTGGAAPGARTGGSANSATPAGTSTRLDQQWLAAHIQALIDEHPLLADARIGIAVRDLTSDTKIYHRAAQERFNIASNAKIITIAAALALLGPNYRYRTAVLAQEADERGVIQGDLYLQSRGDPTLTAATLDRLASELVTAGITAVRGNLIVDDSYFDNQISPPHFDEQPEEQASFRAPVGAVSLQRNAFTVLVRPSRAGLGPAAVWIEPATPYVRLERAEVITQKRGRNRIRVDSTATGDHLRVQVAGQVRAGTGVQRFRRRVDDPWTYASATFRARLRDRGIRLRRPARRGQVPPEAQLLAAVYSEPLSVLVRALGKDSDNYVAEVLLKTIAAETAIAGAGSLSGPAGQARVARGTASEPETHSAVAGPASWAVGLTAVRNFLINQIGLSPNSFRYGNGSGLFDATEIAPAQLVTVLAAAHRDMRYGPDVLGALAIAGTDGTLRRRMIDTPAQGRVRAKTGTLAAVSALAGYAAVDGRTPLAFAIFVNDQPATWQARQQARALQDRIADALITYLEALDRPTAGE